MYNMLKLQKNSVYGLTATFPCLDKSKFIKEIGYYFNNAFTSDEESELADLSIKAVVTGDVKLLFRILEDKIVEKELIKIDSSYIEYLYTYLRHIIELSIDLEDNQMQRKKVRSISVSDDAMSKLNRVSARAGRNRSEVIERLLIGMSEDRILWYARRKPDYDKKEVKTNEANADAESIAT